MMVVQHQPTLATRSRTQSGFSGKPMQCPPLPVSLSVQTVPSSKCVLSPLRWPNWPMPSASRSVEPLVAKSDLAFPCRSSDCGQITDDFEYWRVLTEDSFIFWWGWDLADGVLTFQLTAQHVIGHCVGLFVRHTIATLTYCKTVFNVKTYYCTLPRD